MWDFQERVRIPDKAKGWRSIFLHHTPATGLTSLVLLQLQLTTARYHLLQPNFASL